MKLSFTKSWTVFLTLLALMFSAIGVTPAHAAILTVSDCTAPSGTVARLVDQITAAASGDTINFSCSGTITLAATITIAKNLTINGDGQTVTISGGNAVRVFIVNAGVSLTLNNLTIANGKIFAGDHGGGISNAGTLAITNSTFSGNSTTTGYGGGINNNGTGTLTVTNSAFSGNSAPLAGGGGIFNSGTLTVTNSIFSGNSASSSGNGGGIYNNSGTATITNSSFSVNSATNWGGGIYINAGAVTLTNSTFSGNGAYKGGGIYIYTGATMTLTNSTFSGNNSSPNGGTVGTGPGGGGIYNLGTLNITNSTFSGNSASPGGGIYNDGIAGGTTTLRNTIVANNMTGNCYGTITADSYNLDSDGSCDNATQKTTVQINLGALANNGGSTQTFALLTGSSAIDAGNDTVCAAAVGSPTYGAGGLDQRGVSRPQGAHCDIGSYETTRQPGPNFVVNTNTDINDTACEYASVGNCSLREAIIAANAVAGDDTITVPAGIYTLTIAGPSEDAAATGDLDLTSNITINGVGAGATIIDGGALDRVFDVTGAFTVNISGVTVRNGNTGGADGGGIFNPVGTLTITNSAFSGNTALGGFGGGIFNNAGDLTITNSAIFGNSASNGGGVFNLSGVATITNSAFSGNSAVSDRGGGIFNNAGDLTITNNTISGNSAANGVVYNGVGTVTFRNTIVANSASGGNCSGAFINGGNNIDDGITCDWGSISGSKSITNPLLGALADNGGPTQTFALLAGSPAIDAGNDTVCADPVGAPNYGAGGFDQRGRKRPQGAHCDIGSYEADATLTVKSTGGYDGWILESTATSSKGGTKNSSASTFLIGDNAAKKQYRAILHFNTAGLPNDAVVTKATLRIMKSAGGSGNTSTLGALLADIKKPYFGTAAALAITDFQATASKTKIFNTFTRSGSWYSATLKSTGFTYVNRTGTTQFRVYFTKGDDHDSVADYLKFYSGSASSANRPQLVIQYYVP